MGRDVLETLMKRYAAKTNSQQVHSTKQFTEHEIRKNREYGDRSTVLRSQYAPLVTTRSGLDNYEEVLIMVSTLIAFNEYKLLITSISNMKKENAIW